MESPNDSEKYVVAAHRPLARYRLVLVLSAIFLFIAFLLLLLVALSLPIIKPIYLLSLKSTTPLASEQLSIATELRFGVWGVCATSELNPTTSTLCFGPMLGYTVPPALTEAVNVPPEVVTVVEQALVFVLVLHPIVAGLALLCLLSAFFLASHAFSILVLILTISLALASTVTLAIDLALVIVARSQLAKLQTLHFAVLFGNGVWMILAAVVAIWVAVVALSVRACYCLGQRRHHHHQHHAPHHHSDDETAAR